MKTDKPATAIPLSRDSGIYIPGKNRVQFKQGRRYALSIHTGKGYDDKPLFHLADGTWILDYAEHRGGADGQGYNASLKNCLNDGIPVGVFLKDKMGGYTILGLAYVERYNGFTGMFTLRGPVTSENEARGCFISHGFEELRWRIKPRWNFRMTPPTNARPLFPSKYAGSSRVNSDSFYSTPTTKPARSQNQCSAGPSGSAHKSISRQTLADRQQRTATPRRSAPSFRCLPSFHRPQRRLGRHLAKARRLQVLHA